MGTGGVRDPVGRAWAWDAGSRRVRGIAVPCRSDDLLPRPSLALPVDLPGRPRGRVHVDLVRLVPRLLLVHEPGAGLAAIRPDRRRCPDDLYVIRAGFDAVVWRVAIGLTPKSRREPPCTG